MARKKPDYSHINTPFIQEYCDTNGLKWAWKNQAQGHMIVQSAEFEAYVWVQRMRVMIRMRGGVPLSRPDTFSMSNAIFNESDFRKLVGKQIVASPAKKKRRGGIEPLKPYVRGSGNRRVVVMRIPQGTPEHIKRKALEAQRAVAKRISPPYTYDDDILSAEGLTMANNH